MANWVLYDNFRLKQTDGNAINFATAGDTIKLAIVTASYTPDQAAHDFFNDVNANEVSGTNYSAGGIALASKTLVLAAGVVTFDAADVTILQHAAGFSNGRYGILYKDTGNAATSILIAYADFTTNKGNVSGDLVLQMDAAGIWTSP